MINRQPYELTCKVCEKTFTAYKRTAKYCGKNCAKRGYKAEIRKKQIEQSSEEVQEKTPKIARTRLFVAHKCRRFAWYFTPHNL